MVNQKRKERKQRALQLVRNTAQKIKPHSRRKTPFWLSQFVITGVSLFCIFGLASLMCKAIYPVESRFMSYSQIQGFRLIFLASVLLVMGSAFCLDLLMWPFISEKESIFAKITKTILELFFEMGFLL